MRISDWSSDVCSSDLLGFERGKTAILVRGNIGFPGLSIPAQDTRKRGIKIKTEHRHPGIDTHARAVAELPSNAVEKVGTHRQPAIWEDRKSTRLNSSH